MTKTTRGTSNTYVSTREELHREYAGEIYDADFDTEGVIYQRSSGKRQFTQKEVAKRIQYYTRESR